MCEPVDADARQRFHSWHLGDFCAPPSVRPRLHNAEATSQILGGVVSANWLIEHANEIPCTRLGRSIGWSDDNITQLLAENCFDSNGRRAGGRHGR